MRTASLTIVSLKETLRALSLGLWALGFKGSVGEALSAWRFGVRECHEI